MKSHVLGVMIGQLGLTSPERFTWTLRNRFVGPTAVYYTVIKRNFDPVTFNPSSYVNGVLYTYSIGEFTAPAAFADAVETPADPLAFPFTAVASVMDGYWAGALGAGDFLTGLTRDDVAGLRYLYRPSNYNIENLITNATAGVGAASTAGGGGSPWTPILGTNTVTATNTLTVSNTIVTTALRPGVDKIAFVEANYDSQFGSFITFTNTYKDTYVTNGHLVSQTVSRAMTQPDIIFIASDLGIFEFTPIAWTRSGTAGWANNSALNSQAALGGPGVIEPQVVITFSKVGPFLINYDTSAAYLSELGAIRGWVWGAFDGTTNDPVVFPEGLSVQELERMVLGGQ